MNLQAQIALIIVPQEFTRLCNAVLMAEYGHDFLPADDDRPDRGNDGYLKSERRLFAMHCFKRVQNQSLDAGIRAKMLRDLGKAAKLKVEGAWEIEAWTFLCNYPIPEGIGRDVIAAGKRVSIDVSWRGPDYLADLLKRAPKSVRSAFPDLQVSEVMEQLEAIKAGLEAGDIGTTRGPVNWVPRDAQERQDLITQQPPGWEYLLFAGVLLRGKQELEPKWRDYSTKFARRTGRHLDEAQVRPYLVGIVNDMEAIATSILLIFDQKEQQKAFGAPGEPGDPMLVEYLAKRLLTSYEELLDRAADIRGTYFPEKFEHAVELAALFVDRPARDIRSFIDQTITQFARLPSLFAQPNLEPLQIRLDLTVNADEELFDAFFREMRRL